MSCSEFLAETKPKQLGKQNTRATPFKTASRKDWSWKGHQYATDLPLNSCGWCELRDLNMFVFVHVCIIVLFALLRSLHNIL